MISIIIPIYKAEPYLRECLESVQKQTYKDFEVVCINDGSPDNSSAICQQFVDIDDRFRLFNQENGGVSSARNKALNEVRGEYVCFVDSDDYAERDMIDVLVNNIGSGDLVISNKYCVKNNTVVSSYFDNQKIVLTSGDIGKMYYMSILNPPYCKLYKRKILEKNKIRFPENLSLGEDLCFNLDYINSSSNQIIYINIPLYYYYISTTGLGKKYYKNMFEQKKFIIDKFDIILNKIDNYNDRKNIIKIKKDLLISSLSNEFKSNNSLLKKYVSALKLAKSVNFRNEAFKVNGQKNLSYLISTSVLFPFAILLNKIKRRKFKI